MSKKFTEWSDVEVRTKLIAGHTAFKYQLRDASADLARAALALVDHKKIDSSQKLQLANKPNTLTALYERVTMLTAVIDFIETLGVIEGRIDPKVRLKDMLRSRHTYLVLNVNTTVPDLMGDVNDVAQLVARAIGEGEILHIGEKIRERMGSRHARVMKDLAIIGYLQQFGITFKASAKRN